MDIQPRTHMETHRMRGTETRASDVTVNWTRVINGKAFDFTKVSWMGGKDGYTMTVRVHRKMAILHNWEFDAKGVLFSF